MPGRKRGQNKKRRGGFLLQERGGEVSDSEQSGLRGISGYRDSGEDSEETVSVGEQSFSDSEIGVDRSGRCVSSVQGLQLYSSAETVREVLSTNSEMSQEDKQGAEKPDPIVSVISQITTLLQQQSDRMLRLEDERVHRDSENRAANRKDKVIDRMVGYKDNTEIEVFLGTLEAELTAADIDRNEWKWALLSKLSVKAKSFLLDLLENPRSTYGDLKERLYQRMGISRVQAGMEIFGTWVGGAKGKNGRDQVRHLVTLLERYFSGCMAIPDAITLVAQALYRLPIYPKDQVAFDTHQIKTRQDLFDAVDAVDVLAEARKKSGEDFHRRPFNSNQNCFKCGKPGHKAVDCWSGQGFRSNSQYSPRSITCFGCGQQGHKAPDCPNKGKKEEAPTVIKKGENCKGDRKINVVNIDTHPNVISAVINGNDMRLVVDSGAQISVVPEAIVDPSQVTEDFVMLEGIAKKKIPARLALIPFEIGDVQVIRESAILPGGMENDCALLSHDFRNPIDRELVEKLFRPDSPVAESERSKTLVADSLPVISDSSDDTNNVAADNVTPVLQVQTRQQEAQENAQADVVAKALAEEGAKAKEVLREKDAEGMEVLQNGVSTLPPVSSTQEAEVRDGEEVQDVVLDEAQVNEVCESGSSDECLAEVATFPSYVEDASVRRVSEAVGLPRVIEGNETDKLRKEILEDESLSTCKKLGSKRAQGYFWEDGLLFHRVTDIEFGVVVRLVLPKCRRDSVLKMAHDSSGHLSARKVRALLHPRFTWPFISRDTENYCKSCSICQRVNKSGHRKVCMVERPVISEPFESIAIDLVGPFPKGKGGARYLLTSICMASRWPEAIPLKNITAKCVAAGLMEIFSRTGLPLRILSDQGGQFTSKLMLELADTFGISMVRTTPYHPQSNGTVERMHGTLENILAKATHSGQDWEGYIPLALFALRQCPNRDTGYSPYQLVYGHNMRTPLDLLYAGWAENVGDGLFVSEWVMELRERLEVLRESAVDNGLCESQKRADYYNKGKVDRELEVGVKVLCRIRGMASKLEDSWEGPYTVIERMNKVNYKLQEDDSRRTKVVHINNVKKFRNREEFVGAVTVVAEDSDFVPDLSILSDVKCEGVNESELDKVLSEFDDVMSGTPGRCNLKEICIKIQEDVEPISQAPYKIPMRLREGVREELDSLLNDDIIEPSESAWCSPLVPVVKSNGKLRLCVDFRRLNAVTPQVQQQLPELEDILERAGTAQVLSKVDLAKGFHQLVVEESSRDLTTFCTPYGKFKYKKLPFGLKNAPAYFQANMEIALRECMHMCSVYIDDILIYSKDVGTHVQDIRSVLLALRAAGLTARPEKCEWGRAYLTYLGHRIGGGMVAVPQDRVEAMKNYKEPRSQRDLRAFLGSVGYYRRFIQNFASHSSVLTPATSPKAPKTIRWTSEMEEAFAALTGELCRHVVLTVPCCEDAFQVQTDASSRGLGAVLNVVRGDEVLPVGFYSRQLRGAEKRYSATEMEALGVVAAVRHWMHWLYGNSFTVVTDHRALCYLLTSTRLNRRLRGFALSLQGLDMTIVYRPGSDNSNADGLSRQAWDEEEDDMDLTTDDCDEEKIGTCKKEDQAKDPAPFTVSAGHQVVGAALEGEMWGRNSP